MENNQYIPQNEAILQGKIIRINEKKNQVIFTLSCGNGRQKKNKDGLILRDIVSVRFFDEESRYYKEHFHVGDFVSATAICQNIRDHYNQTTRLNFWGITMGTARDSQDKNDIHIRGKITTAATVSDDYLIVNILTYLEKKRPNTRANTDIPVLSEMYKSITPVGVRCDGDAKEIVKSFTKGTWLDIEGFVYGRTTRKAGKEKKVQRIIAKKIAEKNLTGTQAACRCPCCLSCNRIKIRNFKDT